MPVTATHAKSNIIADFTGTVTVNNSSGGTATVAATDLVRPSDWNSAHQITLQLTGSEIGSLFAAGAGLAISTDGSGVTYQQQLASFFEPFGLASSNTTNTTKGNGTWYIDPLQLNEGLASGHMRVFLSQGASSAIFQNGANFTTNSTGSVTRYQTLYNRFALYKQGTDASTTRLETLWTGNADLSASQEMRVTTNANGITISHYLGISSIYSADGSGGTSTSAFTTSGTVSSTSTTTTIVSSLGSSLLANVRNYVTGPHMALVGFNKSLAPGNYWFGHMLSTTSSSAGTNYGAGTLFSTQSQLGLAEHNLGIYKQPGSTISSSNTQPVPFHGYLATTSSNASSIMAASDIRGTIGRLYYNIIANSTS